MTSRGRSNTVLADDFRDCIACLSAHQVECVLVGGYAVGWYGVVRATSDIDFLYRPSAANVRRLCAALAEFGAPEPAIDPVFLAEVDAITQIGSPPVRIDFMGSISGVTFDEVATGAEMIELAGEHVLVIGLAELKANKRSTGRAKDRSDVRQLEELQRRAKRSTDPPRR